MKYKTLVTRITGKLSIDPNKITFAVAKAEQEEMDATFNKEVDENANKTIIDIDPKPPKDQKKESKPKSSYITFSDKQQELMEAIENVGQEVADNAWKNQCDKLIAAINKETDIANSKKSKKPGPGF